MNFNLDRLLLSSGEGNSVKNEDGVPIRKIHVKGLHPMITRGALKGLFSKFGQIENCNIKYAEKIPIYAFIMFTQYEAASRALSAKLYYQKKRLIISPADTWHQPKPKKNSDQEKKVPEKDDKKDSSINSEGSEGEGSCTQDPPSCSNADQENTILDILNHDCIMHIFSYLSISELFKTDRVSKRWRELVDDKLDGIRVFKTSSWNDASPLTTNTLRCVLKRLGHKIKRLHLDYEWTMFNERTPQVISKFCPNLTDLLLSSISSQNWKNLLVNCTQLKSLSFLSCDDILDRHFQNMCCKLEELTLLNASTLRGEFLKYMDGDSLKKLSMNRCFAITGGVLISHLGQFKNLRKLEINNCNNQVLIVLDQVVELVPNLTEFSCSNIDYQYDSQINIKTLEHLKELEVLHLAKNCSVNDETLKFISKSCPKLISLDISIKRSSKSAITNEGISHLWKLPNLESLSIGHLTISDAAFDKIGTYGSTSKLRTLVCRHNEFISNDCLLKIIQLSPDIRKIDAYGCLGVDEELVVSASEAIVSHPNRTEKLYLNIVHAGMHTDKAKNVLNSLTCPLIQVEIHEEFCDPLMHSYKLCCEFPQDTDDSGCSDDEFDHSFDDDPDQYDFQFGSDDDSMDSVDYYFDHEELRFIMLESFKHL